MTSSTITLLTNPPMRSRKFEREHCREVIASVERLLAQLGGEERILRCLQGPANRNRAHTPLPQGSWVHEDARSPQYAPSRIRTFMLEIANGIQLDPIEVIPLRGAPELVNGYHRLLATHWSEQKAIRVKVIYPEFLECVSLLSDTHKPCWFL